MTQDQFNKLKVGDILKREKGNRYVVTATYGHYVIVARLQSSCHEKPAPIKARVLSLPWMSPTR